MIKKLLNNLKIEDAHPSEETLLKWVDGELKPRHYVRVEAHLKTCWNCRTELDKIEETIALYVDFRKSVQIPLLTPPPSNWSGFCGSLNDLAQNLYDHRKTAGFERFAGVRKFVKFFSISKMPPRLVGSVAGVIAGLLIAALIWQMVSVQTVTATELLRKSAAARLKRIGETNQAVVYQKLSFAGGSEPAVDWEIWEDTDRPRFRQNINDSEKISTFEDPKHKLLREFSKILSLNRMNPRKPLSAASFKSWSDSLDNKTEVLSQSSDSEGKRLWKLQTINEQATNVWQIIEGTLQVRQSDWHVVEQSLRVKTSNGEKIYRVTELDFQISSLTAFTSDFFEPINESSGTEEELAEVVLSPDPKESPELEKIPETTTDEIDETPKTVLPKVFAGTALEVEILGILHRMNADLGEQIIVKRDSDRQLYVEGIVESKERKEEILKALAGVKNNPSVKIDIDTVGEAVAKQKNQPSQPSKVKSVELADTKIAVENELIAHFGTQEKARNFARQTVSTSGRALRRAFALKRLAGQFSAKQLRELKPEARTQFLGLIRAHSGVLKKETSKLSANLGAVFGVQSAAVSPTAQVKDIADVPAAVENLLSLVLDNNRVVRSAMTVSTGNTQFSAIKAQQFRRSLRTAEALAEKLQNIR